MASKGPGRNDSYVIDIELSNIGEPKDLSVSQEPEELQEEGRPALCTDPTVSFNAFRDFLDPTSVEFMDPSAPVATVLPQFNRRNAQPFSASSPFAPAAAKMAAKPKPKK